MKHQLTHADRVKGGRAAAAKRYADKRNAEEEARFAKEMKAFDRFQKSESGTFNGFDMVRVFHACYNKARAREVLTADDCADVVTSAGATIHAGADGVIVCIMTEGARRGDARKRVIFNRSIYIF